MTNHKAATIIFITALCIGTIFVYLHGITVGADSTSYITYAKLLAQGKLFFLYDTPNSDSAILFMYTLYPTYLALIIKIVGTGSSLFITAIAGQVLLFAISAVFLWMTILETNKNKTSATILTLIYIGCFEVLMWLGYILTDSFNLSLLILANYFMVKALRVTTHRKNTYVAIAFLALLSITRPSNYPFIIIALYFMFLSSHSTTKIKIAKISILTILSITAALTILLLNNFSGESSLGQFFLNQIQNGQVIVDRPIYDVIAQTPWSSMSAFQKTEFATKVVAHRMVAYWFLYTQSFSVMHKIWNLLFITPLWICTWLALVYGITKKTLWKNRQTRLITTVFLIYPVFTSITMIDYDFRYRITIIPFALLVIGIALARPYSER